MRGISRVDRKNQSLLSLPSSSYDSEHESDHDHDGESAMYFRL